MIKCRRN